VSKGIVSHKGVEYRTVDEAIKARVPKAPIASAFGLNHQQIDARRIVFGLMPDGPMARWVVDRLRRDANWLIQPRWHSADISHPPVPDPVGLGEGEPGPGGAARADGVGRPGARRPPPGPHRHLPLGGVPGAGLGRGQVRRDLLGALHRGGVPQRFTSRSWSPRGSTSPCASPSSGRTSSAGGVGRKSGRPTGRR
jgi:hypothetical protein